jgi:hypothetical protein
MRKIPEFVSSARKTPPEITHQQGVTRQGVGFKPSDN